jgi:hypothetical protein
MRERTGAVVATEEGALVVEHRKAPAADIPRIATQDTRSFSLSRSGA